MLAGEAGIIPPGREWHVPRHLHPLKWDKAQPRHPLEGAKSSAPSSPSPSICLGADPTPLGMVTLTPHAQQLFTVTQRSGTQEITQLSRDIGGRPTGGLQLRDGNPAGGVGGMRT